MSSGLATILIAGGIAASFAATPNTPTDQPAPHEKHFMEMGEAHPEGFGPGMQIQGILKDELKLSDADITALQTDTSGKTVETLLSEKGITKDQLKADLLKKIEDNFSANFDKQFDTLKTKKLSDLLAKMPFGKDFPKEENILKRLNITQEEFDKAKADGTLKDLMKAKMPARGHGKNSNTNK